MDIPTLDDDDVPAPLAAAAMSPQQRGGAASNIISPSPTEARHHYVMEEEGVVVDVPSLNDEEPLFTTTTTREPSIILLSGPPTYDNLLDKIRKPPPAAAATPHMQASLHTTCSDASIEYGALLLANIQTDAAQYATSSSCYESIINNEDANEDEANAAAAAAAVEDVLNTSLSLQVSEMDISQLEDFESEFTVASPDDIFVDEIKEAEPKPVNLMEEIMIRGPESDCTASCKEDIAVEASNEEAKQDKMTSEERNGQPGENTFLSFLYQYKGSVLLLFIMTNVARGVYNWLFSVPSNAQQQHSPVEVKPIEILAAADDVHTTTLEKDAFKVMLGGFSYYTEEIHPRSNNQWTVWLYAFLQFLIIAAMTKMILQKTLGTSTINSSASMAENMDAECKPSKIIADQEMDNGDDDSSIPSLVAIKSECDDDKFLVDYNLSNYDAMKVSELRDLLRAKKCNYVGKKPKLIHRFVTVYRSELQSLSVAQLRRKMKARGMQQGGLKKELVQQLVEAGLKN